MGCPQLSFCVQDSTITPFSHTQDLTKEELSKLANYINILEQEIDRCIILDSAYYECNKLLEIKDEKISNYELSQYKHQSLIRNYESQNKSLHRDLEQNNELLKSMNKSIRKKNRGMKWMAIGGAVIIGGLVAALIIK